MSTENGDYSGNGSISQRYVTRMALILRAPYLGWFALLFRSCDASLPVLQSAEMQDRTETLQVGSRAPDFSLCAANRDGEFSLRSLLQGGNLILEFLRGTW